MENPDTDSSSGKAFSFPEYQRELFDRLALELGCCPSVARTYAERFARAMGVRFGAPFSRKYFYDSGETSWIPAQRILPAKEEKRRVGLALCHIVRHLLGDYIVAALRPALTRVLILDFDYGKHRHVEFDFPDEFWPREHIEWVDTLLNKTPRIVFQSSVGQHAYRFLTEAEVSGTTTEGVSAILKANGADDWYPRVEVFPDGNRPLRLPLGRGSFLRGPDTLVPMLVTCDNEGRPVRKLRESLDYLFAEAERIRVPRDRITYVASKRYFEVWRRGPVLGPLPAFGDEGKGIIQARGVTCRKGSIPTQRPARSPSAPSPHRARYAAMVAEAEAHGFEPGNRFEPFSAWVRECFLNRGMELPAIETAFEPLSERLTAESREESLKDMRRHVRKLKREVGQGRLFRGKGGIVSLTSLVSMIPSRWPGRWWRRQAAASVPPCARELVERCVADSEVRERCLQVLGVVYSRFRGGGSVKLSMPGKALENIVGKNPPRCGAASVKRAGANASMATLVLDGLEAAGIITARGHRYEPGKHACIFGLALPVREVVS